MSLRFERSTIPHRRHAPVVLNAAPRIPRPLVVNWATADVKWWEIRNATDSVAEIYLYDEIGFWGTSAADLVAAIKEIRATEINLYINSPGGEVFDAMAIHNALVAHPAPVTVTVDGIAASAASFIAMAGNKIIMRRASMMMIHDAVAMMWGGPADLRAYADILDTVSDTIAGIYADRAGGSVADWRARMNGADGAWYSPAETVEAGLADEVESLPPEPAADDADLVPDLIEPLPTARVKHDLTRFAHAGRGQAPKPDTRRLPGRTTEQIVGESTVVAAAQWDIGWAVPPTVDSLLAGLRGEAT